MCILDNLYFGALKLSPRNCNFFEAPLVYAAGTATARREEKYISCFSAVKFIQLGLTDNDVQKIQETLLNSINRDY